MLAPLMLKLAVGVASAAASIPLDFGGNATGRRFDGIGGLSGGGATSSERHCLQQPGLDPHL